jgi:hypothetical protein
MGYLFGSLRAGVFSPGAGPLLSGDDGVAAGSAAISRRIGAGLLPQHALIGRR